MDKLDFSKDLSKEEIYNWLKDKTPEEANNAVIEALKTDSNDVKLDYLTAISLIATVEKDKKHRGNADFLKKTLGRSAYKEMATTGHLSAGFYVNEDENANMPIVDTYALTQRFTKWRKLLNL